MLEKSVSVKAEYSWEQAERRLKLLDTPYPNFSTSCEVKWRARLSSRIYLFMTKDSWERVVANKEV